MTWRCSALAVLLAGVAVSGGCGDELPERELRATDEPVAACELVLSVDLQQIFVNELVLDRDARTPESCTWNDAESGEPFLAYVIHSNAGDLGEYVHSLEGDATGEPGAEPVAGLGDEALWTRRGLFVLRNGRTVQIVPIAETGTRNPGERAAYQELARLLLARLEAS